MALHFSQEPGKVKRILEAASIRDLGNRKSGGGKQTRPPFHPCPPKITAGSYLIMLSEKPDQMLRRYPRRPRRRLQAVLLTAVFLDVTPGAFPGTLAIRFVQSLFRHPDIFLQHGQSQQPEHVLTFLFAPGTDAESGLHEKLEGL